ncbi:MAG: AmmeMemoRadiSam system radical SAM enzyme [Leptospirales bacterium]|nr:AmmeMemoRadiSam system radical SAM enzyme [Leptospirales bacterium]
MPREALYYETADTELRCILCPHNCIVREGSSGICGVRKNNNGVLVSEIYGEITSIAVDPIEKKPLYHFFPGSSILSAGTKGCNLKCPYCQNWNISQNLNTKTSFLKPQDIVRIALEHSSPSIAYTYSEPGIWSEYILEAGAVAKESGINNVLVTNGFINPKPLEDILSVTDAMNIDLKTFNENVFAAIHKGNLKQVLKTIESVFGSPCHLEITTLVVTGINDTIQDMRDIISFIKKLDSSIPWHISRYFPAWKYNHPPTDSDFMTRVYEEASQSLKFVYCGNLRGSNIGSDTFCPSCGNLLVKRSGFSSEIKSLYRTGEKAFCRKCKTQVNILI